MPKKEFIHKGGKPITGEIKVILRSFFEKEDIEKIERLGGRILISLSIPYSPTRKKNTEKIIINEEFISGLREFKADKKKLEDTLVKLSVKELRKLGKLVGYPLRTKSSRQEILDELISCFHGEDIWQRIADLKLKK